MKPHTLVLTVAAWLPLFITATAGAAGALQGVPESFADVARTARPAVVNISTTRLVRTQGSTGDPAEDFFRQFFGEALPQRLQKRQSLGSGFIIDTDGYIVTNAHVVQQANEIRVKLSTREEYTAKIIGSDPKTDLALIKIEPKGSVAVVRLGDSDVLEVGDWVVAIGNPFGLAETVTAGIVSAKGRVIGAGPYDDFIQTDASINPGNSGGPLLNIRGEVIGINSAIFSRSGGSVGIGFAIPVNLARRIVEELRSHGKISRAWLGLQIQEVTPALAQSFGLDHPMGALVAGVEPGSPAAKAGLQRGDVILAVDGAEVIESHQLPVMVQKAGIGNTADLTVLREGREVAIEVKVEAQRAPSPQAAVPDDRGSQDDEWGVELVDLTATLSKRYAIPRGIRGALVSAVAAESPAAIAGLEPGDVIVQVDRQAVVSARTCRQLLARAERRALLLVQRQQITGYVMLQR